MHIRLYKRKYRNLCTDRNCRIVTYPQDNQAFEQLGPEDFLARHGGKCSLRPVRRGCGFASSNIFPPGFIFVFLVCLFVFVVAVVVVFYVVGLCS